MFHLSYLSYDTQYVYVDVSFLNCRHVDVALAILEMDAKDIFSCGCYFCICVNVGLAFVCYVGTCNCYEL
jgi:hypothetical protein